ncbi:hypothetical protein BO94DRAFT_553220 [Aspergillus sclerotioniger CBS 115572]|uniref:Alpha-1,6-mannosyltransferase subunit n=1 Tax=Aspergillus sclerotioniger CBS 115572 TaxID=1450535 RepID=A0A317XC84_9EURO|nr:hypothetical protein BO94DRAFT_553220 [Aspergillus sclerotioniger CBS 115572]PWY95302.1 hypothetical protein BO94DRAFT_553220 [Aspergillus sclerotioniger CBS 115572]
MGNELSQVRMSFSVIDSAIPGNGPERDVASWGDDSLLIIALKEFRRRRAPLLILIAFLVFLYIYKAASLNIQKNAGADRSRTRQNIEDKPRFVYQSPFRQNPDFEYGRRISDALPHDVIWQIMLGEKVSHHGRGKDSIKFEEDNIEWRYNLITDKEANAFIAKLSSVPDLQDLYTSYPHDVLRADLLRYLLLWYHGGYYADIDTYLAKQIKACPTFSLVVGIEVDEPYASARMMREWHWTRTYSFIQYTMFAPKRFSPLLREVIVRVLAHSAQYKRLGRFFHGLKYNEKDILGITGPGVFTDTILDVLSETLPSAHDWVNVSVDADAGIGDLVPASGEAVQRRVTWAPFHKIREGVCSMGGICVLPISVWGNGQRHSGSEGFSSKHACVNHRFGGTWKKKGWW